MKKNTSTIIAALAIIVFVGGGLYLLSRGNNGSPIDGETGADPMHARPATASGSLTDLVGKPVPAFSLRDRHGTEYSADKLKGKNIVLFFNEGIMCYPACWDQIAAFGKDDQLKGKNIWHKKIP